MYVYGDTPCFDVSAAYSRRCTPVGHECRGSTLQHSLFHVLIVITELSMGLVALGLPDTYDVGQMNTITRPVIAQKTHVSRLLYGGGCWNPKK